MKPKFERISKYEYLNFALPQRATNNAAGYDIAARADVLIPSIYKQNIKMLIARFSEKNFLERLEKTELGVTFKYMELLKDRLAKEELEQFISDQFSKIISNDSKEILDIFKNQFTLTLSDMKSFIKEQDLKLSLIPTYLKARMDHDQVLELNIRSSVPLNNYLMLANGTGIIDADYYNNPDNEGHIFFQIINFSPFDILIQEGDIIGQGIFKTFEKTTDDQPGGDRAGGFGSTSK